MKIVHLVWNLIRGGTEGQCARVAMELARRNRDTHRVVVFRREGYFLEDVEHTCGPVTEVGIQRFAQWATWKSIQRLGIQLRDEGFHVVHAWDADAAIFGQWIAACAGIPLITSRRDLGQIYPTYKNYLMRRADQKAVAIVANAKAIVDEFVRQGAPPAKFHVIPNIMNGEEFNELKRHPFPRAQELPPGERVVMVCRLDPEKDVATFISAIELIVKDHPNASFVIAGDGTERRVLESMVANRFLSDKVVFLGDVKEVPALLAACSIGVLTPSRNEGLSNTILEYMAAGLPVVATDCGGNSELIRSPSGGAIVPIGAYQDVASACLTLLRKPALRKTIGDFNRAVVANHHQPGHVADQFEKIYQAQLDYARANRVG